MADKSAKLKVDGITNDITEEILKVVLENKRRQGGGAIENIELVKNGEECFAIVTFEESDAVDVILNRGDTVVINTVTVRVQRYIDHSESKQSLKPPENKSENISTYDVEVASLKKSLLKSELLSEKPKTERQKSLKKTKKGNVPSLVNKANNEQVVRSDDLSESDSVSEKFQNEILLSAKKVAKKEEESLVKHKSVAPNKVSKSRKASAENVHTTDDEQVGDSDKLSESDSLSHKSQNKIKKSIKTTKNKKQSGAKIKRSSSNKELTSRKTSLKDVQTSDDEKVADSDELSEIESVSHKSRNKTLKNVDTAKKKEQFVAKTKRSSNKELISRKTSSKDDQTTDDEKVGDSDELSESESVSHRSRNKTVKTSKKKEQFVAKMKRSSSNKELISRKASSKDVQTTDDEQVADSDELSESESVSHKSRNKTLKNVDTAKKKEQFVAKMKRSSSNKELISRKISLKDVQTTDDEKVGDSDELSERESLREKPRKTLQKSVKKITKKEKQSAVKKTPKVKSKSKKKVSTSNSETEDEQKSYADLSENESLPKKPKNKTLKPIKSAAKVRSTSCVKTDHSDSNEDSEEDLGEQWEATIKAKLIDINKSKEFYIYYFEDASISQGSFYEESMLLDGLNRNLYVTFHNRKAAVATASFKHKPKSNFLKVEMATEEDFKTHVNMLSVHGRYHINTDKWVELMAEVNDKTNFEVIKIIQHEEPRSAILVFNPETCQDVSAATWTTLFFSSDRLVVAPVFNLNCVKVTGFNPLCSDEILKRYMSNTGRSGGGELAFFQRQSTSEAIVIFKEIESLRGILGKQQHTLEGCKLHMREYYPCLSKEVYKKQIQPKQQQLMNVPKGDGRHIVCITHQPRGQGTMSRQVAPSNLRFQVEKLYTSMNVDNSPKHIGCTVRLCKFGNEFLQRCSIFQEILKSNNCKYSFSRPPSCNIMYVKLNYPVKITFTETKSILQEGIHALCNYLDTFKVIHIEIDKSLVDIIDFQRFCQKECKQHIARVEFFVDHLNNSVYFISDQKEFWIKSGVTRIYDKFISNITNLDHADDHSSFINVDQSRETNTLQGTIREMDNEIENLDIHKKEMEVHGAKPKVPPKPKLPSKPRPTSKDRKYSAGQHTHSGNSATKHNDEDKISCIEHLNVERNVKLDEKDVILFQKTKFHEEVEKENEPMKIILNFENMTASIKGTNKEGNDRAELQLLQKSREFMSQNILDMFSKEQVHLLSKQDVQNAINNLFSAKGFNAHFKCYINMIILYFVKGVDDSFLKEIINSHVVVKQQPLKSDMVFILQSEKGRKFLADICESSDGVKVSSYVRLQEKDLMIITSKHQLDLLMSSIDGFVRENKTYEKLIPFSSGKQQFVQKFFSQEMAQINSSLNTLGAKIVHKSDNITVQGLKDGVDLGEKELACLSGKIMVQPKSFKYFGIDEFLRSGEGKLLLTTVENNKPCVITLATDSHSGSEGAKTVKGLQTQPTKPPSIIAQTKVGECHLFFMQGDITGVNTDAIVNPLDSTLKCQSGLGKALVSKGGYCIQTELASSNVQGGLGKIMETSAGNLDNCKSIIHVVCPVFTGTEVDVLEGAITACLKHAEVKDLKTIAIPALGTGKVFKFPPVVACKLLMKSIYQHLTTTKSGLTKMYLCDFQADHVKKLIERFKNISGQEVEDLEELQESLSVAHNSAPKPQPVKAARVPKTFGHINVKLVQGEIAKQKADVIVVTIGNNLLLKASAMTKDIPALGGDAVQQELSSNYADGITPGEFGQTSGGNLHCQNIFYARLQHWKGFNSAEQMKKLVYNILQSADQQNAASIAIPAIGTGHFAYPADIAADAITDAICQFAKDNPKSTLKSINLVVFYKDKQVFQVFQNVLSKEESGEAESGSRNVFRFSARNKDKTRDNKKEVQFHSVKLTIKKGDIASEKCDAIISGIRNTMDMSNSGAVCKALLKKCSSALQDECNSKKDEMSQNGYIMTSAPNLNCQHIYHVSMDMFQRSWDKCITQVLTHAETQGITSISLPALGAGSRHADNQRIKKSIFRGVKEFAKSSPNTLTDVRLVIYSQDMLDAFFDDSDNHRHSSHGQEAEAPSRVIAKVSDHVNLTIYAKSHAMILTVEKELNDVFTKAMKIITEKEKVVKRLNKDQVKHLEDEGMRFCVQVTVNVEDGLVEMKGFKADGFVHVQQQLRLVCKSVLEENHKSLLRAVPAAINWQYDDRGKWKDFEPISNSEIERENKKKSKYHDINDSKGRTYHVDLVAMKEFQLDDDGQRRGQGIKIRRFDHSREGEPLPKRWDSMGDTETLKLVTLNPASPEYKKTEQYFISGGANMPIKKIQRVQNVSLYQLYKAKKRELDNRNPQGHQNEQRLFHGTDEATVAKINTNGFDRGHCGKNATLHGKGVYFALNSSYSVSYATPSAQGERSMYIVRVLTGMSTPSNSSMNHLPEMPGTNIPYDSGSASGMFIIFHDAQAYPEYLITF